MAQMFRTLPTFGQDPRAVAEVVNGIMNGKTNNTGTVTLATGGALTTTINDMRIGIDSKIILIPFNAAAYADSAPFGEFQDDTDQTAASTTTAYAMKLNTTDYSNGVFVSNDSRINVSNYGIYNLQYSAQFTNTDSQEQDISIWFRKNGVDIPKSNSEYMIGPRHGSLVDGRLITALNFFIDMNAGDYVQIMWSTSSTTVSLQDIPAQTSPTRPASPSVIVTMQYVAPSASTNIYVSSQGQGVATLTHFANSTADKIYAYVVVG